METRKPVGVYTAFGEFSVYHIDKSCHLPELSLSTLCLQSESTCISSIETGARLTCLTVVSPTSLLKALKHSQPQEGILTILLILACLQIAYFQFVYPITVEQTHVKEEMRKIKDSKEIEEMSKVTWRRRKRKKRVSEPSSTDFSTEEHGSRACSKPSIISKKRKRK